MKQNVIQNNVPLKQLTQSDNIQSHLIQQEAHFLQQKQMMNPLYNGNYPHMPANVQDSQYHHTNKHDGNVFSHVQQGITNAYDQKSMFDHINKYSEYPKQPQYSPNSTSSSNSNQTGKEQKINEQEFPPEFAASKSDPKYQTLPYNTKFPNANGKLKQPEVNGKGTEQDSKNQNATNVNHMTVHSTPLSVVNKSLATPLSQNEATYPQEHTYQLQKSDSSSRCNQEGKENHAYPQNSRLSHSSQNNDGTRSSGKSQQSSAVKGSSPSLLSTTTSASSSIGFGVSYHFTTNNLISFFIFSYFYHFRLLYHEIANNTRTCKYHHQSFITETRIECSTYIGSGLEWQTITHLSDIFNKNSTSTTTNCSDTKHISNKSCN